MPAYTERMRAVAAVILILAAKPVSAPFVMQSNFWVNLHHFLRAAGRGMPVARELPPAERAAWDAAVARYAANYSKRDLLLDAGMVKINDTLRLAGPSDRLPQIPGEPELNALLESVAPIYRRYWWPAHDAVNRSWIDAAQPLVARWGATLASRVAASYGQTWPARPVPVDLSFIANAVGAYTSYPPHTTIASTDRGYLGLAALEMLFHESSHQWGDMLQRGIARAAEGRGKSVPPQLWHAVLFYNAGELTRRVLAEDGITNYSEYAVAQKVYEPLCGDGCRERVAAAWNEHLDGHATIDEALDKLVAAWPQAK